MSTIHTRCPVTGQSASTGIITDDASFKSLNGASAIWRCPVCGEQHAWSKRDLWLSAEEEPTTAAGVKRRTGEMVIFTVPTRIT